MMHEIPSLRETSHGVYVVGQVGHPQAKVIRIVHLSDTRGYHLDYISNIPFGHILIHSGDFGDFTLRSGLHMERERDRLLNRLNYFFKQQPHLYKIFVAGDEDFLLKGMSPHEIQQRVPNAIYLQDSSCKLLGLRIYGTPWSSGSIFTSFTHGFTVAKKQVLQHWKNIPADADVLVTHMTPWSSHKLYNEVAKVIKPIVHLFSDEKAGPGIKWKDHILFSNGAMYGKHACSRDGRRHTEGCIHQPHIPQLHRQRRPRHSSHSDDVSQHRYVNMQCYEKGAPPSPIVIDVYVVAEEFNYIELPRYAPNGSSHSTNSPSMELSPSEKAHKTKCSKDPHVGEDVRYGEPHLEHDNTAPHCTQPRDTKTSSQYFTNLFKSISLLH